MHLYRLTNIQDLLEGNATRISTGSMNDLMLSKRGKQRKYIMTLSAAFF